MLLMGVLSLFPTQLETIYSLLNPKVQLSLKLFVVPVFTAVPATFNTELNPNALLRKLLLDKILFIIYAFSLEVASFPHFTLFIEWLVLFLSKSK